MFAISRMLKQPGSGRERPPRLTAPRSYRGSSSRYPRDIKRLRTHDPLLFRVAGCARNILTVLRETPTQYVTFNRGGGGCLYSCSLWSCNLSEGRTSKYIPHLSEVLPSAVLWIRQDLLWNRILQLRSFWIRIQMRIL